jgi:hypothetical protein
MNLRALLAFIALSAIALVAAAESPREGNGPASPNDCAVASPVARYVGYGYNHVVSLKNGCTKPVTCEVWTDVDPQPRQTLTAQPGETVEAVLRRGSPAREFKAEKSCKY